MKRLVIISTMTILGASILASCEKNKEEKKASEKEAGTVRTYFFDTVSWSGNTITVFLANIIDRQLENDAFLVYAKVGDTYYNVPGPGGPSGSYFYKSYFTPISITGSQVSFTLKAVTWSGSTHNNPDSVSQIKIIYIESVKQNVLGAKKRPEEIIREQLDKEGIDINNYYEVSQFYGVQP